MAPNPEISCGDVNVTLPAPPCMSTSISFAFLSLLNAELIHGANTWFWFRLYFRLFPGLSEFRPENRSLQRLAK